MKNEKLIVYGGKKLYGEIKNQISKNATLPIMSACLMVDGQVELTQVPKITDVSNMIKILQELGCDVQEKGKGIKIYSQNATNNDISCELMKSMRSSIFLLGPMLSKFKSCLINLPGGCEIGKRPIDVHIQAFKKLGVKVTEIGECLLFEAKNAKASKVTLRIPSVGATENIVQFACKLKGKTTIYNAAREPEVVDLCNFLNLCGAKILGVGTSKITIYGVNKLYSTIYLPMYDRIVSGTVMCAVAMCGGKVAIKNALTEENQKIIEKLSSMGCQITSKNDIITISRERPLVSCKHISTGFYPDFATDMQSLLLAVSTIAQGETIIEENVFENRFLVAEELKKHGANITIQTQKNVKVCGVNSLQPAKVNATDLRSGASLIITALSINGKTEISNIHHIDRGYEQIEEIFASLGAKIKRV